MEQVEHFNRHMMTLARESRGVTQSRLSDLLKVGQGTVSKTESGMSDATPEFVAALSNALEYEPEFFYETGRPYGMPPFHYRKRKKLGKKALDKMIAEMNIRRIHLKILYKSIEPRGNSYIPEIDRDEYISDSKKPFSIEGVARQFREMWLLQDGPIENVVELLEDKGGIVIPCNFDSDLIDAVSQRIDGMPVLFFVNMNAPSDRVRMTLCHELAHVVLHSTSFLDDDVMEREADMFAGAFLLPANQIRSKLKKFDLRQLTNLKRYWKVSMAAIAMRADNLGMITPYQKKSFFIQMSKLGYRKCEPHEPPKEYPKSITKIIDYHLNVLNYSVAEMAKTLFISVDEFQKMYKSDGFEAPKSADNVVGAHLRIVR